MDVCFLFSKALNRGEVLNESLDCSFASVNLIIIMRAHPTLIQLSIRVAVVRFVWVRAYKRHRYGKLEKVRGHYRRL